MKWSDRIEEMKKEWIGQKVRFEGKEYKVIGIDYNQGLLIDKPTKYTESFTQPTTAVETWMVEKI